MVRGVVLDFGAILILRNHVRPWKNIFVKAFGPLYSNCLYMWSKPLLSFSFASNRRYLEKLAIIAQIK